jgi:hypothetical protein
MCNFVESGKFDTFFEKVCNWSDRNLLWIVAGCAVLVVYVIVKVVGG